MMLSFAFSIVFSTNISADIFTYDFSGTLSDHFDRTIDAGRNFNQRNGRLEFDNGNFPDTAGIEAFQNTVFTPGYDNSWSANIDVTIPQFYNNLSGSSDNYVKAGIGVYFSQNETGNAPLQQFSFFLEVNSLQPGPPTRTFGVETNTEIERRGTSLETANLFIDYNSTTKTLSAVADELTILSVNLDGEVDWGMQSGDLFDIVLFADARNEAVAAANPLHLDNFEAISAVPEPCSLAICSLAFIFVLPRFRRRTSKPGSRTACLVATHR